MVSFPFHVLVPITDCLSEPQVPMKPHSPNILGIFGIHTSAFELFMLKRKIMGPCWLQIKKPQGGKHFVTIRLELSNTPVCFMVQTQSNGF